jgi:two-component system, OmpR family, sensor histidine kinase MtrB
MDGYKRSSRHRARPSLRRLSTISAVMLGLLVLGVVSYLIKVTARLDPATSDIERDTRGLALASTLERDLHTHNRISNVFALSRDEQLVKARIALRTEMIELLDMAREHVGSDEEVELLGEASRRVHIYFQERRALEAQELELDELIRRITPYFDSAVTTLESLREMNERQVERTQAEARRMQQVATAAGATGVILFALTLIALVLGVRTYAVRPILDLHRAINRLRDGDTEVRSRESGTRETGELAQAFNEMMDALVLQRENQLAFLAGVAHDLRDPLAALTMGIHALEHESSGARRTRVLATLHRQIGRLGRMVEDFLEASRIEAGQLELHITEFDVRAVVRETIEVYAATSLEHKLSLDMPAAPVMLQGDQLRIEQVLSNLVSNAIKYSPGGGRVNVAISAADGEVVLAVKDEGIGISADDIANVFMPFRRRAVEVAPGAGLGLSIVRRIVESHGGRIEVQSAPRAGSTFSVRLPRVARLHGDPSDCRDGHEQSDSQPS